MTGLNRTDLPTSDKVYLCASSLASTGNYGVKTALSREFKVSRPTVYAAGEVGRQVLERHFEMSERSSVSVCVDPRQLERTIVALRVAGPNSIRDIEDLIPNIYPGLTVSFGKIQGILVEAERRAAQFNAKADLSGIEAGALDEMFSQGDPVLAGVDLDSGYLFSLALREQRRREDWEAVLKQGKNQGLDLNIVVKDAAQGMASAVHNVFPRAEQRDDCFHALYAIGKVKRVLERRCYGMISKEEDLKNKLFKVYRSGIGNRSKLVTAKRANTVKLEKTMVIHDGFERAQRAFVDAIEFIDLETGRFRTPEEMESKIVTAADQMIAIDHKDCKQVGRYLRNRARGLSLYMGELQQTMATLSHAFGQDPVRLGGIIFRLHQDISNQRRPWNRSQDEAHLKGALKILFSQMGEDAFKVIDAVNTAMHHRHRASSAIEGFNAALRPYLYVHKGVTAGFLELFRAYYNLKTRRWGRHKGTSAHQSLTRKPVGDWLEMLGYPKTASLN